MEQAHYLEQDESATDLFGDQGSATCKFGIDGLNDKPKLAYDLKDAQRAFNTGAKRVGTFFDCSMQSLTSFEKPASLDPFHPRAGNEDAYISYQASEELNSASLIWQRFVYPTSVAGKIPKETLR